MDWSSGEFRAAVLRSPSHLRKVQGIITIIYDPLILQTVDFSAVLFYHIKTIKWIIKLEMSILIRKF